MSLAPDYSVPNRTNQKWADIETWRNDLLPTFASACLISDGGLAHWVILSVSYDVDHNVSEIIYQSPTGDQLKLVMTYSNDYLQTVSHFFKRGIAQAVFEQTTPHTVTLSWIDGFLDTYTWS